MSSLPLFESFYWCWSANLDCHSSAISSTWRLTNASTGVFNDLLPIILFSVRPWNILTWSRRLYSWWDVCPADLLRSMLLLLLWRKYFQLERQQLLTCNTFQSSTLNTWRNWVASNCIYFIIIPILFVYLRMTDDLLPAYTVQFGDDQY